MPARSTAIALAVALALAVTGCGGGDPSPSATATPTADGSTPTPSSTAAPSPDAESPTASPTGGTDGEAFSCELPVVEPGSATIANILDVRVGTHDGYDRVVFEFAQGTPEFTLDRAEPPFSEDASGRPIEVEGSAFMALVMRGGTKQTDEGTSSYGGPTEFRPEFPILSHAVEAGDFERQSTWIFGLADAACVRILLLDGPPRLVIDLEH